MRFGWALLLAAVAPLAPADQISAASGVLHRLLGRRADAFKLTLIPKQGNLDVYRLEADQGTVRIAASSGTALTRAAYAYLKDACHCVVTWDGDQLAMPKSLPDFPATKVVCQNQYRHYFNVCTFGYSTAFWDWRRWEREIDWMAVHGINMPLAMTGVERVWESVWEKYGITDAHILTFMTGPAFLPWHWMGNLDEHGGPMPQDTIDRSASLQKRILRRERELGMTPVVPGFSGFVPKEFQDIYPRAKVLSSSGWAGFPPTHQLDPRDEMFPAIQRRFIEAYTKFYGTDHLYLCDLYNEMSPTVSPKNRLADLRETGRAISKSLIAADPQAVWVMQGWLFHNEPTFWKEPEIAAFLGGVDDDRMILLDLACDQAEIWRQSPAFRQKRYIWNLLHGFGGATPLFGDLSLAANRPIAALTDPSHGGLSGMGITMEGIDENSCIYELMCDTMWRSTALDPVEWMRSYVAERYGETSPLTNQIADQLRTRFYTDKEGGEPVHYQDRPSLKSAPAPSPTAAGDRDLVNLMLTAPAAMRAQPLFKRDLVDVTKRYVADVLDERIHRCIEAEHGENPAEIEADRREFDSLMLDLDSLLDTVPQYRMSAWISDARRASGDGDLMETDARMQVTVWGGPELNDYAAKEWSGLVGDFYRSRWDRFFDAIRQPGYTDAKFSQDSAAWEFKWTSETTLPRIPRVDPIEQVTKILGETKEGPG